VGDAHRDAHTRRETTRTGAIDSVVTTVAAPAKTAWVARGFLDARPCRTQGFPRGLAGTCRVLTRNRHARLERRNRRAADDRWQTMTLVDYAHVVLAIVLVAWLVNRLSD
jgi:hypothetical protein